MNKSRLIVLAAALGALLVLSTGNAFARPVETMSFRHIGPEDASIPDISIQVGDTNKSVGTSIFLNENEYAFLSCAIKHSAASRPDMPRPFGTFQVSLFSDSTIVHSLIIQPERMDAILQRLSARLQKSGAVVPDLLLRLEAMLNPPKTAASEAGSACGR
jgi:hypothetical protein